VCGNVLVQEEVSRKYLGSNNRWDKLLKSVIFYLFYDFHFNKWELKNQSYSIIDSVCIKTWFGSWQASPETCLRTSFCKSKMVRFIVIKNSLHNYETVKFWSSSLSKKWTVTVKMQDAHHSQYHTLHMYTFSVPPSVINENLKTMLCNIRQCLQ